MSLSFGGKKKKLSNKMVVLLDKWKEESEAKDMDKPTKLSFSHQQFYGKYFVCWLINATDLL